MNTWQCLRQVQYLIRQQTWAGSANVVFHNDAVVISAAPREEFVGMVIPPVAVIRPGGNTNDSEEPDYIEQEVLITLGVAHVGDSYGEAPVVGMHRTGQTRTPGRGLLEVEEELLDAVDRLNTDEGIVVQHRASSAMQAAYVNEQYLVFRDYLFRLDVTGDRFYHAVMNLEVT